MHDKLNAASVVTADSEKMNVNVEQQEITPTKPVEAGGVQGEISVGKTNCGQKSVSDGTPKCGKASIIIFAQAQSSDRARNKAALLP